MKKIAVVLALALVGVIGMAASWLWWEWDHIAVTASAPQWVPPAAQAPAAPAASRAPCADHAPLRRAWFGDLHVHTGFSMDARSRGMLGTPDDAYRFARGEEIGLGPFDAKGVGERRTQLSRPLDFAAVTDHAEWIGEIVVCTEATSPSYASPECRAFRGETPAVTSMATLIGGSMPLLNVVGFMNRKAGVCGPGNQWCREGLLSAWKQTQEAAEAHYDRSGECRFSSFHAYEYSNSPGRSKVHRNVIFRNERVPELPVSSLEEGDPLGLWEQLQAQCNRAEGDCEAISIPHNANVSNGRMFRITWQDEPIAEQQRQARLRREMEPVVEMMQVKGESECKSGMWNVLGEDEFCDFEKLRVAAPDCEDDYGTGAIFGRGCQSRLDFARYALIEGMKEQARIGVNPYRFGFAGSTDSHNATPGDVAEDRFKGCCANTDNTPAQRLDPAADFGGRTAAARNPGGLMGIWAEENTRDALFDAMLRREVFATSGPRITPRLFVGAALPDNACQGNLVEQGYERGVPMGSVISNRLSQSPLFVAAVSADPEGGLLQRMQLVKIWHDTAGRFHQSVVSLTSGADNSAMVDLDTCSVSGPGATQFCTTWRDPDFDPAQAAAWYLRVIENPSCRWSWRQCLALPLDERPSTCSDPDIPRVIQERAWTSPVWYAPGSKA